MKTRKRIYILILSALMIISMMPFNVFADAQTNSSTESGANKEGIAAVQQESDEDKSSDDSEVDEKSEQAEKSETDSAKTKEDVSEEEKTETDMSSENDNSADDDKEIIEENEKADTDKLSDKAKALTSEDAKAESDAAADKVDKTETDIVPFTGKDGGVEVSVEAPKSAFPEGTTMKVTKVDDEDVIKAINDTLEGDVKTVQAVDITFINADGDEIQPTEPIKVTLKSKVVAEAESPVVVHVDKDDDGNYATEVIPNVEKDANNEELSFEANAFSIYLIGEEGKERRIYNFYDAEGNLLETQILKNGEELIQPDEPDCDHNKEFVGWNTAADGSGTDITFGTVTGIAEEGEVWNVYPKFQTVYYVTFYDADNTTVLETRKALEGNSWTVNIDDLSAEPIEEQTGFAGWAYTEDGEVIEGTTVTANGEDIDLYPVFKKGNWLYFDENDGGTGGGASYIPPEYVFEDAVTVRPADPKRNGYEFRGWYKDAACTQPFTFGQGISENTTIYARWVEGDTSYSIIVWKEKETDTVGMSDDEKSYDYEGSVVIENAHTGSTVSVPNNPYKNYGGKSDVRIGSNTELSNFIGFHYDRCDDPATVAGDGSTVLNVYYDRNEISITYDYPADETGTTAQFYEEAENGEYYFYNDPWDSGYYARGDGPTPNARLTHHRSILAPAYWTTIQIFGWPAHTHYLYSNRSGYYRVGTGPDPSAAGAYNLVTRVVSGVDYPDDETWTGLFGQTFDETGHKWPSTYEVKYYQRDGSIITNTVNTLWQEPDETTSEGTKQGTVLVFLDAFILPEPGETSVVLKPYNTGTVPVRFIQQAEDLTYPDEATNEVNSSGGQFLITDKYNGFKATSYRTLRNGVWSSWTSLGAPDSEGVYTRVPSGYQALEIRYERLTYTVDFQNGSEGSVGNVSKAYNTSMSTIEPPTGLTYPGNPDDADHYTMIGWFADPELTTMVFFEEPSAEEWAQIQRDWEVKTYTVYDKMPANNLAFYAGWFKNWYNVTIDPNGGTLPQGQAESFWVEYGDKIAGSSLNQTTREGHTLLGWMIETEDGEPWNFDTAVTHNLKLVAKWRSNSHLSVEYDAGDGSGAPTDDTNYIDGAHATVSATIPTPPEGKRFVGWRVEGSDTIVYAGDTVTVSESSAGEDNILKLTAVYVDDPDTTSITFNSNYEGGPADIVKTPKALNEKIDLSEVTFEREGYELIGWDTDPNATTPKFKTTDKVGIDNENPDENILYAIWESSPDLSITKAIYNRDYADLNQAFSVQVVLKDSDNNAVSGTYKYVVLDSNGDVIEGPSDKVFDGLGQATFSMKDGLTLKITDLPNGVTYTVEERNVPSNYTVTYTGDGNSGTLDDDKYVVIVNTMKEVIITGILDRDPKYLIPALGAIVLAGTFMMQRYSRRRRRTMDDACNN